MGTKITRDQDLVANLALTSVLATTPAIAFAAYSGGYRGGLISAAIGAAYAFYFFATPDTYFSYTDLNLKK